MADLLRLWDIPEAGEKYMIAGWRQWADAGSISSGLPQYLIEQTGAQKIGEIKQNGFYLFQIPGTHHFLRPTVKLQDGHRASMTAPKNEFFYAGEATPNLTIFLGEEPHLNIEEYAQIFFDAVEQLGVRRVVVVGGVYGPMPYDKSREVSCIYSLPRMKDELARYALKFSDYEGGATIGAYLADQAEHRGIELLVLYGFVPSYDFSSLSATLPAIQVEDDYRAWHELMRRINHMFGLELDLSDLERQSEELTAMVANKVKELAGEQSGGKIAAYMEEITANFEETPFTPLDLWEDELDDIFGNLDDGQ